MIESNGKSFYEKTSDSKNSSGIAQQSIVDWFRIFFISAWCTVTSFRGGSQFGFTEKEILIAIRKRIVSSIIVRCNIIDFEK